MGSVGLNFGSATSGQGINVSGTVAQIMANYRLVEQPWKDQLAKLEDQDAVLSTLGSAISTLLTDVQSLTDAIGVFSAMEGSSSDTNVLGLSSANSSAVAGTHTIIVSNLAQTSVAASGVVSASDDLFGSVTIRVGSGEAYTVNVGDHETSSTLAGLAKAINLAGIGVRASVLTDTSGSRLSVVSGTDGSAGTLTVSGTLTNTSVESGSEAVSFTQVQEGVDANLKVDGVPLASASNKVTNGIQGVTFQLLSASPDEAVQVVIANDNTRIETALNGFVADYNSLIKEINGQEKMDGSGNAEPLYGNPVIAQLQNTLQGLLISAPASGKVTSLYSLGITTNPDGTLSLNSDTLDAALNQSFSDVMEFFQNLGSFGVSFAESLNELGFTRPSGLIALTQKMNASQEDALNDSIEDQEARLAIIQDRLTNELNAVNQTLQAIPSRLNYVNELYAAITGYNQKS